eukprot:CAMPEP_0184289866 /NCGR_PEP_ID=MMETSP1049-20130417/2240_1 /TAXON_ID=77928 /ORGANISM="Proteomonas sulcata, Strain CCMP704" /LENGTH=171 /DNA_ID=CAMNT_0026596833 /DNA_START=167 /DNA_END=682 /DNA_ORIENTATION=-
MSTYDYILLQRAKNAEKAKQKEAKLREVQGAKKSADNGEGRVAELQASDVVNGRLSARETGSEANGSDGGAWVIDKSAGENGVHGNGNLSTVPQAVATSATPADNARPAAMIEPTTTFSSKDSSSLQPAPGVVKNPVKLKPLPPAAASMAEAQARQVQTSLPGQTQVTPKD